MGTLSAKELAAQAMFPIWMQLDAVKDRDEALLEYILKRQPPFNPLQRGERYGPWGAIVQEFDGLWPHRVPKLRELLDADEAGKLVDKIGELNMEYEG